MKKIPKYAVGLALVLLAGGLALLILQSGGTKQNVLPQAQNQSNLTQVSLQAGDFSYKASVPAGSSVYDLMEAALRQAQGKQPSFHFSGRMFSGLGFFVEEINGVKQDGAKGEYWIYYVNNQKANVGVSNYTLKPNDVITWKYEKSAD